MGLFGLAAKVYMLQSSIPGLFIYGLLVFTMEFITPANQATDMAEYMGQVSCSACTCCCLRGLAGGLFLPGSTSLEVLRRSITGCIHCQSMLPGGCQLLAVRSVVCSVYAACATWVFRRHHNLGMYISSKASCVTAQINMGIKGVPPGEDTVQHLKLKSKQVKFWGGIAMAFLAITAYLFDQVCRQEIGMTLATTSTLILVGAVLQTSRQVGATSFV